MTTTTELVPFHGDILIAVEKNGADFIAIKPICERLGLARQVQQRKLQARPELWGGTIMVLPSASGEQETFCLPVNRLAAWLFSINPGKVREDLRDALTVYQIEAADALDAHFRGRREALTDAVIALEEQVKLANAAMLSASPLWNKVARPHEAGVHRSDIRYHINRSEKAAEAILENLERSGAIDPLAWGPWPAATRRRFAMTRIRVGAVSRHNLDAVSKETVRSALASPNLDEFMLSERQQS